MVGASGRGVSRSVLGDVDGLDGVADLASVLFV